MAASPLCVGGGVALPVPSAVPDVTPGSRLGAPPDDCAVPALLVPRGEADVLLCAIEAAGPPDSATTTVRARIDILVIGKSPSMIHPATRAAGSRGNAPHLTIKRV